MMANILNGGAKLALICSLIAVALVARSGFCAAADLSVAAEFFSTPVVIEAPRGKPPSAIVRGRDGRILGYAFSTRDVSGSVGYSGRPLDIVAAVTPGGIVAGARLFSSSAFRGKRLRPT